jgi:hypothetical protein
MGKLKAVDASVQCGEPAINSSVNQTGSGTIALAVD